MASLTLVWTALPNGLTPGGKLRLSAFVSPRLYGTAAQNRLSNYPMFTAPGQSWARRLKGATLRVEVDGQLVNATVITEPAIDEALWDALVGPTMPVAPYRYADLRQHLVFSHSVARVLDHLEKEYATRAAEPPVRLINATFGAPAPQAGNAARGQNTLQIAANAPPPLLPELEVLSDPLARTRMDNAITGLLEARWSKVRTVTPQPGDPSTRTLADVPAVSGADIAALASQAGVSETTMSYRLMQRFYTSTPHETSRLGATRPGSAVAPPKPDFHAFHGALGDYPVLLRKLGFVVDLELAVSAMPDGRLVRIVPSGLGGAGITHASPPTRVSFAPGGLFRAAPRTGSTAVTRDGRLPLGSPGGAITLDTIVKTNRAFFAVQGDPDATGLKAVGAAAARAVYTVNAPGRIAYETNVNDSNLLPAPRSGGLAVYRADRSAHLALAVRRGGDVNAAIESGAYDPAKPLTPAAWPVHADELVRGYVVEVLDESGGGWKSLCARTGRYTPTNQPGQAFTATDVGFVKVSSVRTTPETDPAKLVRSHEALFQWDGWSLVCERPGLTMVPRESHGQLAETAPGASPDAYERVGRTKTPPPPEIPLETAFRPPPGSLPRLRFGRRYRLRARAVDLAGNVPDTTDAPAPTDTEWVTFARLEPLEAPTLVPRVPFSEGESLERMVIRSDPGADTPANTAQYVARPDTVAAIAGSWYGAYLATCDRHVLPPRTSQQDAERHAAFDGPSWQDANARRALLGVALKEAGTVFDPMIVDTATGEATIPQVGLAIVTPPNTPAAEATNDLSTRALGDPLGPGQFVVIAGEQAVLPYLPDVLARGATFQHLPGTARPLTVPFRNAFPAARPFVLRLAGSGAGATLGPTFTGTPAGNSGASNATLRPAHRPLAARVAPTVVEPPASGPAILQVFLPPAAMAEVLYSTAPKTPGGANGEQTVEVKMAETMDVFGMRRMARTRGSASPALDAAILGGLHEAVTPPRRVTLVHAVQRPVTAPRFTALTAKKEGASDGYGMTFARLAGTLGVHVLSTGRLDLLASWNEPTDSVSERLPRDGVDGRVIDRREGRVAEMPIEPFYAPLTSLAFPISGVDGYPHGDQSQADFYRHDFGDTRRRTVRYRVLGTTRFREYFHPRITQDIANISRTGAETVVTIPNSARPDAPKLAYAVPAFRWQTEAVPNGILRRRCGGGLRIWLDRPWYSSGEQERLGVLLLDGALPAGEKAREDAELFSSRWGVDPIWSGKPPPALTAASFVTRKEARANLTIPDRPALRVTAVGHEVHFDAERRQWYCDLELDTGMAYFPFVRLALARFQPVSVPNAHLSGVVLTDFAQVVPTRTAVVTREQNGAKLNIQVGGVLAPPHAFVPNVPVGLQNLVTGDQTILADYLVPDRDRSRLSLFVAAVERQTAAGTWQAVSADLGAIALENTSDLPLLATGQSTFAKTVDLPANARGNGVKLRVSITETEVHPMDANAAGATDGFGGRIVYADTLDLP